ncbi:50S ribosomal protein L6 [uncultured archaeon]|nr:50S ribosomal protein L6 [uncultured archaeon]
MKQEIFQEIEIPEKVEVTQKGNLVIVKGPEGENERKFNFRDLEFEIKGKKIKVGSKKATKKEKKRINSTTAHLRNMLQGSEKKYEYKLKVCFVHFPSTVEVKGSEVIIKNFLGEKVSRKAKIPKGAEVKIDKDIIIVKSSDKEIAGQAAANLEIATRIRKRDRRVFQDGIFITSKCGVEI